jgi:hypothetical protein
VQAVRQARAARTVTVLDLLGHQSGVLQNRQMLADRVVVEPYVVGELAHAHRSRSVDDVAEQAMTCRVTESPGFALYVWPGHGSLLRIIF